MQDSFDTMEAWDRDRIWAGRFKIKFRKIWQGNKYFGPKARRMTSTQETEEKEIEKEGSQSILNISSLLQRSWGRQGGNC